jgi:hypothetical protein
VGIVLTAEIDTVDVLSASSLADDGDVQLFHDKCSFAMIFRGDPMGILWGMVWDTRANALG